MKNSTSILLASLLGLLPLVADDMEVKQDSTQQKLLAGLTKDSFPGVDQVVVKGDKPRIIYIPIIHDNPQHRVAAKKTVNSIEDYLRHCQEIAEELHRKYGVGSVLLEGIGPELAGKYNSPKYRDQKLSVGKSKSIIFKIWFDLLNKHHWHLIPAYEKRTHGPLTLLGSKYNKRIQEALAEAKSKGWFRSRKAFVANQEEFQKLIAKACDGYNDQLDAILKEDPGLKREYDITVTRRNKVFIDNTMNAEGPGLIMCGGGHVQDLIDQFDKRELSYVIIVPEGTAWPPPVKDEKKIHDDMRKLGCQLKTCTLKFGDGSAAKIQMPIK